MFPIEVWLGSLLLYSILRIPDVESTRLILTKLKPEQYEVNVLLWRLIKKSSFNKAMIIQWLIIAPLIASLDALFVYPALGFSMAWLFYGLFHLVAAANNFQLYSRIKMEGVEAIEESTRRFTASLRRLSTSKRIAFFVEMNLLDIILTAYGFIAITLFGILLGSMSIQFRAPFPYFLSIIPVNMIIVLVLYPPFRILATFIIWRRRLKFSKGESTLLTDR